MKKERGSEKAAAVKGILLGLLLLVLVCGIAIALLTNVDWLYRIDMKVLDIGTYSGGIPTRSSCATTTKRSGL